MEELLRKIDNKEPLYSQDYWEMIDNYSIYHEEGEDGRWTRGQYNLIKLGDRYFELCWEQGLTEMQENYWEYPEEVRFLGMHKEIVEIETPIIERIEEK